MSVSEFVAETSAGRIRSLVYAPPSAPTASLYLLHGRAGSAEEWLPTLEDIAGSVADGTVPPVVAVAVDGPWLSRGHWWVDSSFRDGSPVETAVTRDLVDAVDTRFGTPRSSDHRFVAGVSMGGWGAVRYLLASGRFSRALVLSPAVYLPVPPDSSNARVFGAFGVGESLFDAARFEALNYPALVYPAAPVSLRVVVGDLETPSLDGPDNDLDVAAARLVARLRRAPSVTARLEVLDGAHDWDFWRPAFAGRLAWLIGGGE